jgi:hypothetical protein
LIGALILLGATTPAVSQLLPLGSEFVINDYTTGLQRDAAVASDGSGRFVVVWTSYASPGSDTSDTSVHARRYDATGAPLGPQFQVNTYTTGKQFQPSVATDAAGGFLVVWASTASDGVDTDFDSVQGQAFDASGVPAGAQFQVNTYTIANQNRPAAVSTGPGQFVVAWQSNGSNSDPYTFSIQARRFGGTGTPLGGEFQVNTYTTGQQYAPAVSNDGDGNFVVVWESAGSAGSDKLLRSVQARRFDAAGNPLSTQVQVNTYTTGEQFEPAVASDAAGNFVVSWQSNPSFAYDTSGSGIMARRFDGGAGPLSLEFNVNVFAAGTQRAPAVATDSAGAFVVAFFSYSGAGNDSSYGSTQARRFSSTLFGSNQFLVNTYTPQTQEVTAIDANANDAFIILWNGSGDVRAQRYGTGRPILGGRLLVKDRNGDEENRKVIFIAKDLATDIGPSLIGDPTTEGATLRIVTSGGTPSDQTFILDPDGWTAIGSTGFSYAGPTGADGDPVRRVVVKRSPRGKAILKAILAGNVGTQSLDVVPPNPGSSAGLALSFPGGGVYCTSFGSGDEGIEIIDDGQRWKMKTAAGKSCPDS